MSSVHDGVSCDTCMKNNFSGKRYKCLVCYDFDLCSNCYDNGATNSQHLNTHPMQCILTRADYDLYYGGDQQVEPHSFTCPYCGLLGFSEQTLCEHIGIEHEDDSYEVVCPICAAIPSGDPNHLTEDLLNHINLEHRSNIANNNNSNHRDNNSTSSSTTTTTTTTTSATTNNNNTNSNGSGGGGGGGGDDSNSNRFSRRLNSRTTTTSRRGTSRNTFQYANSGTLSALVSSTGMDPIAELLSQLSGVRRAAQSAQNSQLQLQQLQAQLSREREHLQQTRHLFGKVTSTGSTSNTTTTNAATKTNATNQNQQQTNASNSLTNQILELPTIFQSTNTTRDNRYLLSKYDSSSYSSSSSSNNNDDEQQQLQQQQQQQQQKSQSHHHHHHHHHHHNSNNNNQTINQMNQSFFIQDILLSTLMKQLDNTSIDSSTSELVPISTTK